MTEMKTKKQKKKLELNSFYAIKAGYENNSALVREKPYTDKWLNNKLNYTFKKDIEKRQAIANQERQILENIEKIKIERDTPAREVIEQFREYNERSYLIKSLYKNEDMNTGSIDYNDTLSTIKTKYNCVKKKTMSKDFQSRIQTKPNLHYDPFQTYHKDTSTLKFPNMKQNSSMGQFENSCTNQTQIDNQGSLLSNTQKNDRYMKTIDGKMDSIVMFDKRHTTQPHYSNVKCPYDSKKPRKVTISDGNMLQKQQKKTGVSSNQASGDFTDNGDEIPTPYVEMNWGGRSGVKDTDYSTTVMNSSVYNSSILHENNALGGVSIKKKSRKKLMSSTGGNDFGLMSGQNNYQLPDLWNVDYNDPLRSITVPSTHNREFKKFEFFDMKEKF